MKLFGLTEKQMVALLTFLSKKPYNEVAEFISMLQSAPQVNVETNGDKPNEGEGS